MNGMNLLKPLKRVLALGLAGVMLLGALPALASEEPQLAREVLVILSEGRVAIQTAGLRDGRDTTSHVCTRGKSVTLTLTVPEETPVSSLYVRMKTAPTVVKLRQKQVDRYVEMASVKDPGPEFVMNLPALTGTLLLELTLSGNLAAEITELRAYGAGAMPESLPARTQAGISDLLLIAPDAEAVDLAAVKRWTEAGLSVVVAVMTNPENPLSLPDALWQAGVHTAPLLLGNKQVSADTSAKAAETAWPQKTTLAQLASLLRRIKPMVTVTTGSGTAGSRLRALTEAANEVAGDYSYETDAAASDGLWATEKIVSISETDALLANFPARSAERLMRQLSAPFLTAQHGDPAGIPWPEGRDAEGYLPAGEEFLYEDADQGLWAYLSSTVQVQIVRYDQPDIPRRWFVTDIRFNPDKEQLKQVLYANASFEGQMIYPETLAQTANLVVGFNGDYYPYRVNRKTNVGNIIRNRKVIHEYRAGSNKTAFPVLDTAALHDNGSMSLYKAGTVSAQQLLATGTVHDALSFGPILVCNGEICIWNGSSHKASEPRTALGMVSPGHYVVLTVEGRFAKGVGPAGLNMNQLAALMYIQGVRQAINLDGGNTAALLFMGKKLNRTASKSGKSETEPRNMMELFGVGTSNLVHTDAIDRK